MNSNIRLFPNPASSEVTIQLQEIEELEGQTNNKNALVYFSEITQIKIIDKMGSTKKVMKFGKGSKRVSFSISELQQDLYFLEITDDVHKIRKPLLISK